MAGGKTKLVDQFLGFFAPWNFIHRELASIDAPRRKGRKNGITNAAVLIVVFYCDYDSAAFPGCHDKFLKVDSDAEQINDPNRYAMLLELNMCASGEANEKGRPVKSGLLNQAA